MSERTQGKTIAVLIGVLALFGIGAIAIAGGKKKPPRPVCGEGKTAVFNVDTNEWECIDVHAPECGEGEHAEWKERDEEWVCVSDLPDVGPDEPEKPDCGVGKKAIKQDDGSWLCITVDKPECGDDEHLEWSIRSSKWKCVKNDPIIVPGKIDDIVKPLPRGGNFWKWRKDWILLGKKIGTPDKAGSVAYTLMRMEAFEAAKAYGELSDTDAWAWVNSRKYGDKPNLRITVANIILCCGWNDATAGTWGYCGDIAIANKLCPETMRNHPGPHGRAIRPLPQHADQIPRIKAGQKPARVVGIGNPGTKGDGSSHTVQGAPGGNLPTIWCPRFNREVLWNSGGLTFTTEGLVAEGNALPPQWVLDIGWQDFSGSGIKFYGCSDYVPAEGSGWGVE